ncbi:hypothetical protein DY000_02022461 [Brassica cretica]|uniref:Uncharacterized protein n=1 Tax=Brassica cretica TaxID=69181 RepID=A0ABQ7ECA3_BRACR|nr:hypothetical protein DY000_02022461 [Brassica cretica]
MDWCRIDVSEELGRYVATELWLEPGRYVATELWLEPGRYVATELWLSLGRYVATERDGRLIATFSRCVTTFFELSPDVSFSLRKTFHLEDVWDDLPVSRLKYNALDDFQEVFHTTSRKSSIRLPGSLPYDFQEVFQTISRKSSHGVFSHVSPFHNRYERFCFNYMVLIFHSFKGGFDMQVFQIRKASGTTYMLVV